MHSVYYFIYQYLGCDKVRAALDCHSLTGFPAAAFDSAEAAQAWLDGETAAQLVAMMATFRVP